MVNLKIWSGILLRLLHLIFRVTWIPSDQMLKFWPPAETATIKDYGWMWAMTKWQRRISHCSGGGKT
jgi:hypothetical protein